MTFILGDFNAVRECQLCFDRLKLYLTVVAGRNYFHFLGGIGPIYEVGTC